MLKELGTMSGSFYYPNQLLSAGVDISVFGFDKYREMMVRVLGGKRLGDQWALGLGVHYSFLQTDLLEIQDPDCQQILESLSLLLISC